MIYKTRLYLIAFLSLLLGSAYAQRPVAFKQDLNKLKYDSVKVYSFNCTPSEEAERHGPGWDVALITADQKWAYSLDAKSSLVSKSDLQYLFKTLFANEHMDKDSDPVGCYQPRLGFAFFNKGVVVAHIDVCLECAKCEMEIFSPEQAPLKYYFGTLRRKTKDKLRGLCSKYGMGCCTM